MAAQVLRSRTALLQLMEAIAKHNAIIRARFPASHTVRHAMETNLSGAINDAPFAIQVFAQRGEDAACLCEHALKQDPLDVFTEGVAELIENAQEWAGEPAETDSAVPIYPKTTTLTSLHLLEEIECRARRFFDSIYGIMRAQPPILHKTENEFWSKYRRASAALNGAENDNSEIFQIGALLSQKLPSAIVREILSCLPRKP